MHTNAYLFREQLSGIADQPVLLAQLRRLGHLAIRDAYQREQRRILGSDWGIENAADSAVRRSGGSWRSR